MCCLLSILWFAFEYVLKCVDKDGGKFCIKDMLWSLVLYGSSMVLALFLSAGLFFADSGVYARRQDDKRLFDKCLFQAMFSML